jgi:hypothetical protein
VTRDLGSGVLVAGGLVLVEGSGSEALFATRGLGSGVLVVGGFVLGVLGALGVLAGVVEIVAGSS